MKAPRRSAEMYYNIELAIRMGRVMEYYFHQADDTIGTEADKAINDAVVRQLTIRNRIVVSKEGGSARYGDPNAEYLDPIDGSRDFELGRHRVPPYSIAAFSLGSVANGRIVRGVVNAPLLPKRRLYWAEAGGPAYRLERPIQFGVPLVVNPRHQMGIVLVADSPGEPAFIKRLARAGFTPVGVYGSVMKACCIADAELFSLAYPDAQLRGRPIVGFVSESAQAHDYVAAACIVRGAGGFVTGFDGNELCLTPGNHGSIFANSAATHRSLLAALQAG